MARARKQRSDWRAAHGAAKAHGALVVLENMRDVPLAAATPAEPAVRDRDEHGHFLPGNKLNRLARSRAGQHGYLAQLDAKADPAHRAARNWGKRYAAHRVEELTRAHGGELSGGVCVLVQDAGGLRADARYLQARGGAERNPELLKAASALLASARQAERDAWELAARECESRRRTSPSANRLQEAVARRRAASQPITTTSAALEDQTPPVGQVSGLAHDVDAEESGP
jgi:hypothetical protein